MAPSTRSPIHRSLPVFAYRAVFAAVLACTGGCATQEASRPMPQMPATYTHADAAPVVRGGQGAVAWWRAGDLPVLDAWVDSALARNADLAMAGTRLRRAMLEARLAGAQRAPAASGGWNARTTRSLDGEQRNPGSGGSGQITVSWELDLFGRLGALQNAARFDAEASAQDRQAVRMVLVASVAELYFQLAHANERAAMAEDSERDARRIVDLVQSRYQAGAEGRLALHEALQVLDERVAELAARRQATTVLRERVRVLLDGAPPPGPEPQALPGIALPPVQPGIPGDLLGRRPDLQAARLRLQAAGARTDAASASYYPNISLTGALGSSSRALLDVLANPVATLGIGMTLPFLQARTLGIETEIARTRYEEAVAGFRKALYTALGEVDQTLSARTRLAEQEAALQKAQRRAAEVTSLYEARYRVGLLPLRSWLDAKERLRAAEAAHSAIRLAQLLNQIQLRQVLGSDWIGNGPGTDRSIPQSMKP